MDQVKGKVVAWAITNNPLNFFLSRFLYHQIIILIYLIARLNKREIDIHYIKLIIIWGEICSNCQKTLFELGIDRLEIHEIKYARPLKTENMRLMCHACNHMEIFNKENITSGREPTPEFRVSRTMKYVYYEWFTGKMMNNNNKLSYEDAVNGGAHYTGLHIQTIKNMLKPLTEHSEAPFIVWGDMIYIRGREPRRREPIESALPNAEELK